MSSLRYVLAGTDTLYSPATTAGLVMANSWNSVHTRIRFDANDLRLNKSLETSLGRHQLTAGVYYSDYSYDHEGAIEVDLAQRDKQPKFHCRYSGAAQGTLTLTEEVKLGDPKSGELEFGTDRWKVSSTAATENKLIASPGSLIGYEIRGDNRVVAAVEVINSGRVWISPAFSQLDQDRFAAAITALLIYREIEPTVHD